VDIPYRILAFGPLSHYNYRSEVESYRDPVKKQPRQRVLRFLGRVDQEGFTASYRARPGEKPFPSPR
jgi:hypothetical protein